MSSYTVNKLQCLKRLFSSTKLRFSSWLRVVRAWPQMYLNIGCNFGMWIFVWFRWTHECIRYISHRVNIMSSSGVLLNRWKTFSGRLHCIHSWHFATHYHSTEIVHDVFIEVGCWTCFIAGLEQWTLIAIKWQMFSTILKSYCLQGPSPICLVLKGGCKLS